MTTLKLLNTCTCINFVINNDMAKSSLIMLGMWSKVSGKFAILYSYKIGGGGGVRGTFGKNKIQDSIFVYNILKLI